MRLWGLPPVCGILSLLQGWAGLPELRPPSPTPAARTAAQAQCLGLGMGCPTAPCSIPGCFEEETLLFRWAWPEPGFERERGEGARDTWLPSSLLQGCFGAKSCELPVPKSSGAGWGCGTRGGFGLFETSSNSVFLAQEFQALKIAMEDNLSPAPSFQNELNFTKCSQAVCAVKDALSAARKSQWDCLQGKGVDGMSFPKTEEGLCPPGPVPTWGTQGCILLTGLGDACGLRGSWRCWPLSRARLHNRCLSYRLLLEVL